MAYTPVHVDWKNDPDTTTPILAEDLEHMEQGIVTAAQDATESQKGNVELASPAEMTAGSDLALVPAVKRVADYVTARLAALPTTAAASETVSGIVELATAAEVTAGTDLARVPSVKRIVDYINTRIAALPGVSAASETTAGVVELATAAEMTTGTDLTRAPAVKRVADYVIAAIAAAVSTINTELADKADISGSIRQFSDVSDNTPADLNVLRYNNGLGLWTPGDLTAQFATVGVDGRIIPAANPQYFKQFLVVNEGDPVPPSYPAGGIVLSRPAAASIVPINAGLGNSSVSAVVTAATTVDLEVGDYIHVGWAAGNIDSVLSTIVSVTVNAGAISAFTELGSGDMRGNTVQVRHGFARVTTRIPTGSIVTLTGSASRPTNYLSLSKCINIAVTTPNDSAGSLSGNGATNSTLAKSFGGMNTVNPNDLAFMTVGYVSGTTPTNARTVSGTNDWQALGGISTSGARGVAVFYKTLTSPQTGLTGTFQFTAEDGTSGAWAAVLGALRKA